MAKKKKLDTEIEQTQQEPRYRKPKATPNKKDKPTKIVIATDSNIRELVKKAIREQGSNANLNHINTFKVTDMSNLFNDDELRDFSGNISEWSFYNVTTTSRMFEMTNFKNRVNIEYAPKLIDMSYMFYGSSYTGKGASSWDVSAVQNMEGLFMDSAAGVGDVSKWKISNVTNMKNMFACSLRSRRRPSASGMANWDVSNVTDMTDIFRNNQSVPLNWKLNNAVDIKSIFTGTHNKMDFIQYIGVLRQGDKIYSFGRDSRQITVTSDKEIAAKKAANTLRPTTKKQLVKMIAEAIKQNGINTDLNHIDITAVTDLSGLFKPGAHDKEDIDLTYDIHRFDGNISEWNTSNVTNMRQMFQNSDFTGQVGDIKKWNVSKVVDMNSMFHGCKGDMLKQIRHWYPTSLKNGANILGPIDDITYIPTAEDLPDWILKAYGKNIVHKGDHSVVVDSKYATGDAESKKWDTASKKEVHRIEDKFGRGFTNLWNENENTDYKKYLMEYTIERIITD